MPEQSATEGDIANERFHALDALRAAMVLLGIVLHGGAFYMVDPPEIIQFTDPMRSPVCDWLVDFLHTFRLPTFFVMAGFFTALLTARRGVKGMLRNRWQRVMLPLICGWAALFPLIVIAIGSTAYLDMDFDARLAARQSIAAPDPKDSVLLHLWFLYHLVLFCLAAAGMHWLVQRVCPRLRGISSTAFRWMFNNGTALLVFPLLTAATLYPMRSGSFDTSAWLLPPIRILAAYGVFFAFGWFLFGERDRLEILLKGSRRRIAAGILLWIVHHAGTSLMRSGSIEPGSIIHLASILSGAWASWWMIVGLAGICLRRFSGHQPWIRYLSDSSYFLYLAHMPVVLFFQGLLAPVPLPALLKFCLVLIATLGVIVPLYHYQVRGGYLGERLSGRRYPVRWPSLRRSQPEVKASGA